MSMIRDSWDDGKRREVVSRKLVETDASLNVTCLGCGTALTLWYNGGELDIKECCGYLYYLDAPVTLLVIEREVGDEA